MTNPLANMNRSTLQPTAPVLQADGLSFGYAKPPTRMVFENLSVRLPAGVTLVCGDEGVGKTSLLQLLAGALPPSSLPRFMSGQLQINGVRLTPQSEAHRQHMAWFDPRDNMLDEHTARQIFSTLPQRRPGCDLAVLQTHIDGLSLEDRKSTRLNSSHIQKSRMPSSA